MNDTRVLTIDIGGNKYQITSDDDYLEHIRNGFEPETVSLFRALLKGGETVLDVGANIGCTSLLFSESAEHVYAFEPSPTTFSFLQKNVSGSQPSNISLFNIGLGEEPAQSTLTFSSSNRSGGFVSDQTKASEAGHTTENIVIRKTDEIVETNGIEKVDFIKLDVEGFEASVLRGATQTLARDRPIVALELNHWCLNAFQRTSIPDFFDLLRSVFPVLLAVDRNNYMNLHNNDDSYFVMYQHIVHMRFPNIVAGFEESQFNQFKSLYEHGFTS